MKKMALCVMIPLAACALASAAWAQMPGPGMIP